MSSHHDKRNKLEQFQEFCQQAGFFIGMIIVMCILFFLVFSQPDHTFIGEPEDSCYGVDNCALDWEHGEVYGSRENCYVDSEGSCRQFFFEIRAGCGLGPANYLVKNATGDYKYQEAVKQKCIEVQCAVWTWNSPSWERECTKDTGCAAYFWTYNTWDDPDMLIIGDKDKISDLNWQQGKPEYGYTSRPGYLTASDFTHNCDHGNYSVENDGNMTTSSLASYFCRINMDLCNLWYWEDHGNGTHKLMYCVAHHTPEVFEEARNNLPDHIESKQLFYAEVGYDTWEYMHVHESVNSEFNFFLTCLLCGAMTKWFQYNVLNKLGDCCFLLDKIPFTVYILIMGWTFQVIVEKWDDYFTYESKMATMLRVLNNVNPDFLLLIFIPPLIFESSFSSNYHTIRAEFGQALILAGPGVVIASFVTAFFAYYIYAAFTSYWKFYECLLFGSIVSATDPVAVVALLKELGASARLSTLIEAESLLNDGSAVVLYHIVLLVVQGAPEGENASDIIVKICQLIGGGVACGMISALMCVQFLSVTREDSQIEITITIFGSYMSFFIAEITGTSGILSVVVFGLILSKYSTFISPKVMESLHVVWEYLGWLANVIIFFISGVVLANRINYSDADFIYDPTEWIREIGWAIVFFLVIHIARATAIGVCYPLLQRTGYGIGWKNAVVMWAAGLRGAIGLALGLKTAEVAFSTRSVDGPTERRAKEHILFQVCIFVLLTLLINGISIRWLLEKFGMTDFSKTEGIIYAETLDHVETCTKAKIEHMKLDMNWRNTEWDQVKNNLPDFGRNIRLYNPVIRSSLSLIGQQLSSINVESNMKRMQTLINSYKTSRTKEQLQKDLKNEIRFRYLSAFRANYKEQFEEGSCSAKVFRVLTEAAERAMDTDVEMIKAKLEKTWGDYPLKAFDEEGLQTGLLVQYRLILPNFELPKWLQTLQNGYIRTCVDPRKLINGSIAFGTEVALAFLKASRNVSDIMQDFPELMSNIDSVETYNGSCTVAHEHAAIEDMVEEVIRELEEDHADIVRRVKTKQALIALLYRQRKYIKKSKHHGMLHEKEFNEADELILQSIVDIGKREDTLLNTISCGLIYDSFLEEVSLDQIFDNCPIVMDVDESDKSKLYDNSKEQVIEKKGTRIPVAGLYFILKGSISVEAIGKDSVYIETMPKGSTIGAYDYLSEGDPINTYSTKTNIVIGRHMSRRNLDKLIKKSPRLKEAIAKLAGMELINAKYSYFFNEVQQLNEQVCKIMIFESNVIYGEVGSEIYLTGKFLLLLSGELSGKLLGTISSDDAELNVASAPQLVVNTGGAKWSKAGCALQLNPERSKYVYQLEGTMRSSRFTKMKALQVWDMEMDIKEEYSAEFDNTSIDDDDEEEDPPLKLGFADITADIELNLTPSKSIPM